MPGFVCSRRKKRHNTKKRQNTTSNACRKSLDGNDNKGHATEVHPYPTLLELSPISSDESVHIMTPSPPQTPAVEVITLDSDVDDAAPLSDCDSLLNPEDALEEAFNIAQQKALTQPQVLQVEVRVDSDSSVSIGSIPYSPSSPTYSPPSVGQCTQSDAENAAAASPKSPQEDYGTGTMDWDFDALPSGSDYDSPYSPSDSPRRLHFLDQMFPSPPRRPANRPRTASRSETHRLAPTGGDTAHPSRTSEALPKSKDSSNPSSLPNILAVPAILAVFQTITTSNPTSGHSSCSQVSSSGVDTGNLKLITSLLPPGGSGGNTFSLPQLISEVHRPNGQCASASFWQQQSQTSVPKSDGTMTTVPRLCDPRMEIGKTKVFSAPNVVFNNGSAHLPKDSSGINKPGPRKQTRVLKVSPLKHAAPLGPSRFSSAPQSSLKTLYCHQAPTVVSYVPQQPPLPPELPPHQPPPPLLPSTSQAQPFSQSSLMYCQFPKAYDCGLQQQQEGQQQLLHHDFDMGGSMYYQQCPNFGPQEQQEQLLPYATDTRDPINYQHCPTWDPVWNGNPNESQSWCYANQQPAAPVQQQQPEQQYWSQPMSYY